MLLALRTENKARNVILRSQVLTDKSVQCLILLIKNGAEISVFHIIVTCDFICCSGFGLY